MLNRLVTNSFPALTHPSFSCQNKNPQVGDQQTLTGWFCSVPSQTRVEPLDVPPPPEGTAVGNCHTAQQDAKWQES